MSYFYTGKNQSYVLIKWSSADFLKKYEKNKPKVFKERTILRKKVLTNEIK